MYQYKPSEKYVLFKERLIGSDIKSDALLFYDIKEDKISRIDENVICSELVDDAQIYYTKGLSVYKYDLDRKQKMEIQLPEELIDKLKDYVESYEEYIEVHFGEEN
ncbi:MAG: hypothetical protein E7222_11370 [Clostridiales bacterium]|uniref:hypothetical protein n=1 Tax=Aminipila sp. TaxID=2060095 RepID=UPI001D56530F|nr:hypothetical protein [Aminipila sp.]MBE6035278.1 hypothetical protein [Clostridiales bacterium]